MNENKLKRCQLGLLNLQNQGSVKLDENKFDPAKAEKWIFSFISLCQGKNDFSNIVFLDYFPTNCFEKNQKFLYYVQSASTYNALLEGSSEVDAVCT